MTKLIVDDCWDTGAAEYLFTLYGDFFYADVSDCLNFIGEEGAIHDAIDAGKWHHLSTIKPGQNMTDGARCKAEFAGLCASFGV